MEFREKQPWEAVLVFAEIGRSWKNPSPLVTATTIDNNSNLEVFRNGASSYHIFAPACSSGGFAGAFVAYSLIENKSSLAIGGFAGAVIAVIVSIIRNGIAFGSWPAIQGWQDWLAVAGLLLWTIPGAIIAYVFSSWSARQQSAESQRG